MTLRHKPLWNLQKDIIFLPRIKCTDGCYVQISASNFRRFTNSLRLMAGFLGLSEMEVFTNMLREGSDRLALEGRGGLWKWQLSLASEGGQDLHSQPSCWDGDRKVEWRQPGEWDQLGLTGLCPWKCPSTEGFRQGWAGLPGVQLRGVRRLRRWRPQDFLMGVTFFITWPGPWWRELWGTPR